MPRAHEKESMPPPDALRVVPVELVEPLVLGQFLSTASRDAALCDATYLPESLGAADAVEWSRERHGRAWVLVFGEELVGWFEVGPVRSACGFDLPVGSIEWEIWLLPQARGRRLMRRALGLLRATLRASGATHVVGVAWESNVASVRGMQNAGFTLLGHGWWEHEAYEPGWCEVWLLDL
jgi:L-amino acid N-acyltransferase YncA